MKWFNTISTIAAFLALASPAHATSDPTQTITASSDGHFLTTPSGEPFFWLADTGWALFTRLTREETELYLNDRASKGFNVIQAVLAGTPFDDLDVPNRYGHVPFIDKDPSRPNPAFFAHVDWVIERAAAKGIRFALVPIWSATQVWEKNILTKTTARAYGKWLARRYRGRGAIWVLGGDIPPIYLAPLKEGEFPHVVDHRPIYDALAAGIAEGDGGDPFITYHPAGTSVSGTARPRPSLYYSDRPWLDMNMLQSGHVKNTAEYLKGKKTVYVIDTTRNYEVVSEEYNSSPVRPVVDGEPRFEDLAIDLDVSGARGFWSGYDARNAAYHAVFAGAAGHTYGHHYVWQFYRNDRPVGSRPLIYELSPKKIDWREALERPAAGQMQHLKALMLSRPYFTRIPDQSLILGDAGGGTGHISATRSRQGDYAMIYLPHGQPATIDLSRLSGSRLTAWWYNPRTGTATRMRGHIPRRRARTFAPPVSGPESDWVLVLDNAAKGFVAPGKPPAGK